MTKILVTGASGFIGSRCIRLLSEQSRVIHAAARRPPKHNQTFPAEVIWHVCNLEHPREVHRLVADVQPDVLLHLAWCTGARDYMTSDRNFVWLASGRKLIDSFLDYGGRRIIAAGTCAEYDWKVGQFSEDTTSLSNQSPYANCKVALQEYMFKALEKRNATGVWTRIFFAFGPGEPEYRLIPQFVRALTKGEVAVCKSHDQVRDYIFVNDVASILVGLVDHAYSGVLNAGTGEPRRVGDIVTEIGRIVGNPGLIETASPSLAQPRVSPVVADVTRLNKVLPHIKRTEFSWGLEETVSWWSSHVG